jgi:hypothetical protein
MRRRHVAAAGIVSLLLAATALSPAQAIVEQPPQTGQGDRLLGYDKGMLEALAKYRGVSVQAAAARLDAQAGAASALEKLKAGSSDVDGSYFVEADNKLRVNVSTQATANLARAAGLVPRVRPERDRPHRRRCGGIGEATGASRSRARPSEPDRGRLAGRVAESSQLRRTDREDAGCRGEVRTE